MVKSEIVFITIAYKLDKLGSQINLLNGDRALSADFNYEPNKIVLQYNNFVYFVFYLHDIEFLANDSVIQHCTINNRISHAWRCASANDSNEIYIYRKKMRVRKWYYSYSRAISRSSKWIKIFIKTNINWINLGVTFTTICLIMTKNVLQIETYSFLF